MATAFFGSAFFGGEFFSVSVTPAADDSGPTPAGRSRGGRRWLIGNKVFHGTADEAEEYARSRSLPEPEPAPKKPKLKVVPKPEEKPLAPVIPLHLPSPDPLSFGLLNDISAAQAFADATAQQVKLLRALALEQDDEDVLLLL